MVVAIAAWFGWGKYNNALEAIHSQKTAAVKGIQEQTVTEDTGQLNTIQQRKGHHFRKARSGKRKAFVMKAADFQKQYAQDSATFETDLEQSRAKLKAKDAELGVLLTQGTALRTQYDNAISGLASNSVVTQPINPNDAQGYMGHCSTQGIFA